MADIFISYSKKDAEQARLIEALLEAQGYSVWWDTSLETGEEFRQEITKELDAAKAVIALWTQNSVKSVWVNAEASRAHSARKLVPLKAHLLAHNQIPLPFSELHTTNFDNHQEVLDAVERRFSVNGRHEVPSLGMADLPIRELFVALAPYILNLKNRDQNEIASQVRDQLALGRLTAWGRDDAAPRNFDEYPPPKEIEKEYWLKASLHPYYFMEAEEHRFLVHAYAPPHIGAPRYRDISFNRSQAKRLWPFLAV